MKPSEELIAARELIEDKNHWTQEAFARVAEGYETLWDNSRAVRFCALGALNRVMCNGNNSGNAYGHICLSRASNELFPGKSGSPQLVNDELGHEAVMQMYDRAIELAREDEG